MEYTLREKVALLDKATFNKIRIKSIRDIEELQRRDILTIKEKSKANYIMESGQEFSSLQITGDGLIDKLVAGSKIIGNNRIDYCNLSTSIKREGGTNLDCYSVTEYQEHLEKICQHLWDEYGIEADFNGVCLKEVEINKTFKLEQDFREYHRVLQLIMSNLPAVFTQDAEFKQRLKKSDESFTTGTYYARTNRSKRSERYLLLKIYDKTRSMEQVILLTDSYMRVEVKLVGADKIERDLGTKEFYTLTDDTINAYFERQMQKFIIQPYTKWKAKRDKFITDVMKTQLQENPHHWIVDTLRILENQEIKERCPVLLDVSELMPIVDQVVTERKNRYKTKKAFRKQAQKYETVLCQNDDKRLAEILEKVTS